MIQMPLKRYFRFSQELQDRFSWFKKQFLFLDDVKTILFTKIPQKMLIFLDFLEQQQLRQLLQLTQV